MIFEPLEFLARLRFGSCSTSVRAIRFHWVLAPAALERILPLVGEKLGGDLPSCRVDVSQVAAWLN